MIGHFRYYSFQTARVGEFSEYAWPGGARIFIGTIFDGLEGEGACLLCPSCIVYYAQALGNVQNLRPGGRRFLGGASFFTYPQGDLVFSGHVLIKSV